MKLLKFFFLIICLLSTLSTLAQQYTAAEQQNIALAEAQLKAYNARDIEAFLVPYSDTVKVYAYPNQLRYQGKETMRKVYTEMFANLPDLHCTLVNRIAMGSTVIDQEDVFIRKGQPNIKAIAIYKMQGDKIVEVTFIQE